MSIDAYRRKYAYGEDYGTSYFKFGPVAEEPYMIENRGYFIPDTIITRVAGVTKTLVVGPEVTQYLGSKEDAAKYLVYPMRDGIVRRGDTRAWQVLKELTRYGFEQTMPQDAKDFEGFYVTAALSAIAPKYMYEEFFQMHADLDEELGAVKAVTIIPQPLAVAIAQKAVTCTVVESGHGNTQITPISQYPIRGAIVSLNRGGAEADAITGEILKDAGYGDLASEEKLVRMVKENIGLIPRDLDEAIRKAKENPEKFKAYYKVPGTLTEIDLEENSWMRFLIGEIIFNPEHEIFQSYYRRGLPRPRDTVIGDEKIPGTVKLGHAIAISVGKTSVELQPYLYKRIILSGGNFAWKVPPKFEDVACDAATKIYLQMKELDLEVRAELTSDPAYSVWKGAIVYSIALPDDYLWDWNRMEGWYKRGVHY